jgi:hypothetical protein
MKKPVQSDGDDQVSDNENSQAKTEYEPQNNVKIHKVMLDMPKRICLIHCLFDQNKNV